jgi:hypothetical protein
MFVAVRTYGPWKCIRKIGPVLVLSRAVRRILGLYQFDRDFLLRIDRPIRNIFV